MLAIMHFPLERNISHQYAPVFGHIFYTLSMVSHFRSCGSCPIKTFFMLVHSCWVFAFSYIYKCKGNLPVPCWCSVMYVCMIQPMKENRQMDHMIIFHCLLVISEWLMEMTPVDYSNFVSCDFPHGLECRVANNCFGNVFLFWRPIIM